jgi:exopolysaccharide biosynthesis WecB/TagA/CpsF family protein
MSTLSNQIHLDAPVAHRHSPITRMQPGHGRPRVRVERAAPRTRGTYILDCVRLFDLLASSLLVVVLSPAMLLRGLRSLVSTGTILERIPRVGLHGSTFHQLVFAGTGFGRELPTLFNVIAGHVAFSGPRLASPAEFAPDGASSSCGIAHRSEAELDEAFVQSRTTIGCITLALRGAVAWLLCGGARATPPSFRLLEIDIRNTTMDEAVSWIVERAAYGERTSMAFVNSDCLNAAVAQRDYRAVLQGADRVLPDGIGVNLACRMRKIALVANLNGTDLFPELCKRAVAADLSIFLLGAGRGVAEAAAANVQALFPGLRIAGTQDGYFEETETARIVQQINDSKADILLVAMGAPQQELWIDAHRHDLEVPVCMGVGGLFDFYSGRIPRAPLWMREIGLEWMWRLMQEPGRMWRRYVIGNPLFLYRVLRETRRQACTEHQISPVVSPGSAALAETLASMRRAIRRTILAGTRRAKRMIDISVSLSMLTLLSPLFMLTAALIRIESPGPVFYRQSRIGYKGRIFTMWKFRSMYVDADRRKQELLKQNEMAGGILFKMRRDPRITRVGRVIRRASIDELPQLWNVLIGDMSLVGPRPALPSEVSQYSLGERGRLDAVPGITCIWQVSGRSDIPFDKQVKMDLDYIYSVSLKTDLGLLFKTVPAIVSGRGAY